MQDCLNIVACVCRRFYKIVNDSGALWRSLKTDAEFDVDSFELVIVNHAKHFRDLALQFSQKRARYNSPAMHIENTRTKFLNRPETESPQQKYFVIT